MDEQVREKIKKEFTITREIYPDFYQTNDQEK